ncbi:phage holin family protein [Sphingobium sp. Sx8-8]|uniref:phage holin family protein n=1 Tax=Sphingobium sp. Sx8-8 TaxID=2933617 RepID=UPI001F5631CD|nr:phage holin family protein [Sphingobium sp. Sx8-8]
MPDESVREVFSRLYADGRAYAEAEVERQKLRAGIVAAGVRNAAIFAAVAVVLLFAALVACLIGVIIALTPDLGAGWATAAVAGGSLAIALLLLLIAKGQMSQIKRAVKS